MFRSFCSLAVFLFLSFSSVSALLSNEYAPLFPFVISHDAPANVTNVGSWNDAREDDPWYHAPAGKFGLIRVEDGRFVHDRGRFLILGTNTCFSANFPDKEQAEKVAARLARLGFNCVRLHHMDNRDIWGPNPSSLATIDPGRLDKLDYFIHQLKLHGIYVNINLHVSRTMDQRDGFPGKEGRPNYDKGLDNFYPDLIEMQKRYARDLLTHVNPYTGTAYAEEPAVAMVEINNENSVVSQWAGSDVLLTMPDPYRAEFRKQWNEFLKRKYGTTENLKAAWHCIEMPPGEEMLASGTREPKRTESRKWYVETDPEASHRIVADGRVMRLEIEKMGKVSWHPQMIARSLSFQKGVPYTFSIRMKADRPIRLGTGVRMAHDPWSSLGFTASPDVDTQWKTFQWTFLVSQDEKNARLDIGLFQPGIFEFSDASLKPGGTIGLKANETLEEGTVPLVGRRDSTMPPEAVRDFCEFLFEIEDRYWVGFYRFLKDELGVRQPISGTQLRYGSTTIQAKLDYIDNHAYWNHPAFPGRPWDGNNWYIRDRALVRSPDRDIFPMLGTARVQGKPYTVSEFDAPMPNRYAAEALPMLCAFGRFQDWDGIFHFAYSHDKGNWDTKRTTSFFDMVGNTVKLAHMPACAALFRRGDVAEGKEPVLGGFTPEKELEIFKKEKGPWNFRFSAIGLDPRLALFHRTALDLTGRTSATIPEVREADFYDPRTDSPRTELSWATHDTQSPFFLVRTDNSALFTGFIRPDLKWELAPGLAMQFSGKTRLDWATVSLVSAEGNGFQPKKSERKPVRVLVTATGLMQNTDMKIENLDEDKITFGNRWGKEPVLCEGIPVTLQIPKGIVARCYPLDGSGNRQKEIESDRGTIRLGPEYKTIWYEFEFHTEN